VGGGASVINAAIGTTVVVVAGILPSGEWFEFGLTWWVSAAMGVILIAPLLITWRAGSRPAIRWHGVRLAELLFVLLATAVVSPRSSSPNTATDPPRRSAPHSLSI
jgi:integral membrane sensor domain MASE1